MGESEKCEVISGKSTKGGSAGKEGVDFLTACGNEAGGIFQMGSVEICCIGGGRCVISADGRSQFAACQ